MATRESDAFSGIVAIGIICTTLALLAIIGLFALPIGVGAFIAYKLYLVYHYSDRTQERKAREHTDALYRAAKAKRADIPDEATFVTNVERRLPLQGVPSHIQMLLLNVAADLYAEEQLLDQLAPPPAVTNSVEGAQYRDYLARQSAKVSNPESARIAEDVIVESLSAFIAHLPQLPETDEAQFTVPITDVITQPLGDVIESLVLPFYRETPHSLGMFSRLREILDGNVHTVSGIPFLPENRNHPRLVLPSEYEGENVQYAYLNNTPLLGLCDLPIPFELSVRARMEHQWIVAPPGAGKSTVLQHLLTHDFARVAKGEASVIVIDSNRDLAKSIERLQRFAKGGDLEDRLIVIDVEDVEYPVAINIFDTQTDATDLSPRDREVLYNSSVSMLSYIFNALLGAELTSRQSTLFNFTIELLLALDSPTIDTLIDIMQPEGFSEYKAHVPKLSQDAQQFFKLKFGSKEFTQTKSQVVDRLFAVKRIRALARIFSSPKTKLDLFDELSKGRVIVINAAKSVLQEDGVEVFTRFFLASILLAAEKRQLVSQAQRLDTFLYLDEAQDVIRRDERLPVLLDQARKLRLSCCISHQRMQQMNPQVLNALMGSTAIKFAANLADSSLGPISSAMHTTPAFLQHQPPFHFAAYVRGMTDHAVSLRVPHVDFSAAEQMSDAEYEEMRQVMRARYATKYEPASPAAEDRAEARNETLETVSGDPDNPDTDPTTRW